MGDEEWLALVRAQRHSFVNHLQVISGWLQLGQPERARQYLLAVAARLEVEAAAARTEPPALALVLLQVARAAELHNVELQWEVQVAAEQLLAPAVLTGLRQRLMAAVAAAAGRGVRLLVRVDAAGGGLRVHTVDIPADPKGP